MKTFKGRKQETLLLIAPLSAKDNEDFMKQALCCISISGIYWGQILYYT